MNSSRIASYFFGSIFYNGRKLISAQDKVIFIWRKDALQKTQHTMYWEICYLFATPEYLCRSLKSTSYLLARFCK